MSSLFTPFSALPLRHTRATVSCCSSGHVSFIKEVAVTEPPTHLHHLLKVLQTRGETIISPGAKQGLIPLAIPLSKDSSGSVTALLRWPTAPPGLDMPVVEVWRSGVRLIARNVDEYIHRILVQEDAQEMSELYIASAEAGEKLYKKGAFAESQIDNLDVYVLKKVGLFPDVLEKKVLRHFDEGDHVSAMVTGEFYTRKDLFPGFGRPFVYYANILQKVGRDSEAKEAARVALKSPWWTLGCPYEEVASIAQWEDDGKAVLGNDVEQREYLEYDMDKLFQSISVTRLMTSSFRNLETSASAGPSSPSMRMATRTTPQSPRVFGSLSLKQALRDRCVSRASEMAALKRLSNSTAASPRVSEADRIKSLYNQVSNNRSVDKGKGSTSRSVPQPPIPIHEPSQAGTSLGSRRVRDQVLEIELDENVASPSALAFVEDDVKEINKHVTSPPSDSSKRDNATELEKKILSPTLDLEKKGKLNNNTATSGTEKSRTVCKVTRKPKKKILLKKKLKIGIVSVAKKDEETDVSLDSSATKLLCQRCHCSLKSTSIDNHEICAESSSSMSNSIGKEAHQVASENSSTSCNVSQRSEAEIVVMKQNVSSSNDSGNKFDFSLSSKDSLGGDYSRSTSMSEESNLTRFSCGNKPHMSMDVRWEAVKHAKLQYGSLGLRHFNLLKKLGCGDIGTVYLAELIGTNCLFAIKVMDNEFLARRKKSPRAQAERDILKMLDHPFLPTLYAQFTSDHLSCLVMEYCPGGDLHVLRQKQLGRCFPEPAARFYVAEILLALEYLHMLGVIYRDLKPENILVREDGHIMLTDFDLSLRCAVNPTLLRSTSPPGNDPARTSGPYNTSSCIQPFCLIEPSCQASCFSPRLSSNQQEVQKPKRAHQHLPQLVAEPTEARSNSFVGTHEYLAPEIIRGEGHGAAVDWWTFGVLLYELLYGKTPFKGYNNDETLANVVLQSLKFPDSPLVSFQAKDLIRGLLVKEPENRLGSEKGSAEIKRHPFFERLNWALIRCAIPPELPDFCEFGGGQEAAGSPRGNDNRYLKCKAIGNHLEFELF